MRWGKWPVVGNSQRARCGDDESPGGARWERQWTLGGDDSCNRHRQLFLEMLSF